MFNSYVKLPEGNMWRIMEISCIPKTFRSFPDDFGLEMAEMSRWSRWLDQCLSVVVLHNPSTNGSLVRPSWIVKRRVMREDELRYLLDNVYIGNWKITIVNR